MKDDKITKGRILLVDDESAVLGLLKFMLTDLGYTTLCVENPIEALELFQNEHERIDVVLTDLGMPQLPGLQLARRLNEIDESMPIILLTGNSESIPDEALQKDYISGVLDKPMTPDQLLGAIEKARTKSQPEFA